MALVQKDRTARSDETKGRHSWPTDAATLWKSPHGEASAGPRSLRALAVVEPYAAWKKKEIRCTALASSTTRTHSWSTFQESMVTAGRRWQSTEPRGSGPSHNVTLSRMRRRRRIRGYTPTLCNRGGVTSISMELVSGVKCLIARSLRGRTWLGRLSWRRPGQPTPPAEPA